MLSWPMNSPQTKTIYKTHAFMDTNTDEPKFVIYRTVKRFKLLNC